MTAIEAAAQLGLKLNTVRILLRKGAFPNACKQDGVWRIPVADVQAYAVLSTARGYGKQARENRAAKLQRKLDQLKGRG